MLLDPKVLYRCCDHSQFTFQNTSEIPPQQTIYGQDRGTTAIAFGIDIDHPGYNIYVLGPSGSGRLTAVQHFIDQHAQESPTPDDWCYVYNFQQPHKPKAIRLPAGYGRPFKDDLASLIATLQIEIAEIFESDVYLKAQAQIREQFENESQRILSQVQQVAAQKSFNLQSTPQGAIVMIPIRDGKPIPPETFAALPEEEQAEITAGRRELEDAIDTAFRTTRDLGKQTDASIEELRRDMASQIVEAHMVSVLKKYDVSGSVIGHLWAVKADILNSLDEFEGMEEDNHPSAPRMEPQRPPEAFFKRYEVNVFVENEPKSGAPVILLDLPTYQNLIGRVEYEVEYGMLSTDFTQITNGALHRANGGFLILRAGDVFTQPLAWEALKLTLISGQVVIEDSQARGMSVATAQHLEPEPIPIKLKVVLVGNPDLYYILYEHEEDFRDLFRVKADFVDAMKRTEENEVHYANFIATLCHQEKLLHFDADAVGRIIDYGSWMVSDQNKLSATFGQITPLIYESVFFAKRDRQPIVTAAAVDRALAARHYRNNESEELSLERITEGTIFIDTTGEVVGQVNGLVVMSLGDHIFGLPSRLTARVFMGRKDVVQIDREARMTGPIHDKGLLILQGYLGGRYAHDYPLTLSASLTFEQNYGGVEGDSASSTELYALLSAISQFPIRQDIAVTGSVNQRGQIQPVGGVTQKIEGFFKVCQSQGLTGSQGVIIPKSNISHLMLNREVVEIVEQGQFHIYAIETVDEGIALLTGRNAEDVHQAVDDRLRQFAKMLATYEGRS